jgi:hypothetical protein
MYAVSEVYKTTMKQPVQRYRLAGTIGDTLFTQDNILKGSFSITNQCTGSDEITVGQVYIGELNVTFMNIGIDRYSWKGKEIRPVFGLQISDGTQDNATFEDVPLGVYTISSAEWTASGVVVKAYDHMALLDTNCNQVLTEVTPYMVLQAITKATGVEFANTEDDFKNYANGTSLLSETTTNDVETWRDLLSWIAQTCACYATADRDGKIVLRPFNQTIVDTLDNAHRFTGASFSDYVTRYTGISMVNMSDDTTSYYGLEVDDGLTMNLGSNPFLQYGTSETKEAVCRAILTAVQMIQYVPFTCTAIGNPAYDLGDVLVFSDGIADGAKLYCITKYTFTYNSGYEMSGVGSDPALSSARSKTDKDLSGLASNTDENTLIHYLFTNSNVLSVGDGKRITAASIRFVTATKNSEVTMWAEILLKTALTSHYPVSSTTITPVTVSAPPTNAELQEEVEATDTAVVDIDKRMTGAETELSAPGHMTVKVYYTLNGVEPDYHPIETYDIDGDHVLGLHYYIGNVKANTAYTFIILLEAAGGSITIEPNCLNAVIEGMALAGTASWDGTITVEDQFTELDVLNLIGRITEETNIAFLTPTRSTATDAVGLDPASLIEGFSDTATVAMVVRYYIMSKTEGSPSYSDMYVITNSDNAFVLQTSYQVTGKAGTVDSGYLNTLDIYEKYPEIATLETVEVD